MLDLFGAIGATDFDITHIHLCGENRGLRRNRSIEEVNRSMLYHVASAELRQNNVIAGKCSVSASAGSVIRIETPGGGGWGSPEA